jgi:hypothetical protein
MQPNDSMDRGIDRFLSAPAVFAYKEGRDALYIPSLLVCESVAERFVDLGNDFCAVRTRIYRA